MGGVPGDQEHRGWGGWGRDLEEGLAGVVEEGLEEALQGGAELLLEVVRRVDGEVVLQHIDRVLALLERLRPWEPGRGGGRCGAGGPLGTLGPGGGLWGEREWSASSLSGLS